MRSVVPVHPSAEFAPLGRFGSQDLDVLRLMLRGSSVVDWYRLHFTTREGIDAFVRVNELDPANPSDRFRLETIKKRALDYLREHLSYRRVPDVIHNAEVPELFEYASGKGRRAYRLYACLTLKVMHIIHYVEAHELLSMLPISNAEIAILLHGKVERVVRGLMERNFPILEFSGNTKTRNSMISKLLAKKDTQAAQVFDKLRFRFVVERHEEIPSLLLALTRELLPFNYLVPAQADNTLVDLERMLMRAGNLTAIRESQAERVAMNERADAKFPMDPTNEFSGPDYRVVHFVAEVPIRIDRVMEVQGRRMRGLGPVVFGTVEFQVMDAETAKTNETGPNSHANYKRRQRSRVKERLERGKREKVVAPASSKSPKGSA